MTATATPGPLLGPLLAACFSASVHGGRVIREVVQQHVALDMVNKQEGAYDPQTVADRRSQQRIIHALREAFPLLTIVGEEGELAPPAPEDVVQCDLQALDDVAFEGGEDVRDRALDWNDLVLWVDPLDGTKRFAAKMYDEVSVLIGITYKQRPIAGVVHLPFHGEHGVTYWGTSPLIRCSCRSIANAFAALLQAARVLASSAASTRRARPRRRTPRSPSRRPCSPSARSSAPCRPPTATW
jgi:3'-phosphoadenosine 5'-phosphosulfate (PAPS) 3'-phosphatase